MAKFPIIPKDGGTARYSGCPTFTGTYMKPGLLEFREVSSPTPIDWAIGDYVVYTRTGFTYRLYSIPQLKKQARSMSYGGAFVYQGVQLFDASKMLEYCPFRDLVLGDNRIHFSTQPSISTFEGCDGLARRFEACLCDQYGANSWRVRIATSAENPDLYDLMMEPREFTVSGVNILECLDKIYEIWPEVGWVYKVENGIDTIIIGGGGINSNTGSYAYGKGNGLTSLTRTAANAEEIANRIFAYGSSRNMVLPSWYRNQDIKDAESVDIENLMLPILPIVSKNWSGWGLTGGKRDAAKAFVENAASILKNGLRPATVYFDGKGEYPEIYPSIRETTIGMVRNALGDSTAKYYPSSAIYTDTTARIDTLLSVQSSFDSGKQSTDGKSAVATDYADISETGSGTAPAGSQHNEVIFEETMTVAEAGTLALSATVALTGSITAQVHSVILTVLLSVNGNTVEARSEELENNGSQWALHTVNVGYQKFALSVGDTVTCTAYIQVVNFGSNTDASFSYSATGNYSIKLSLFREKTFKVSLRQLGFDINEQADLGDGKTIAMRTGDCAGRSFSIKSVQYNSANDCWDLECWRSEDESLSQWFPNSQFGVAVGDEFVLLDIAMPDIYIAMASEKLLDAARELLEDSAVERWQYSPEIDAKFMVENSRTINAGEYLIISDADIIGPSAEAILVDTITINEGEAAIPTYKVTLRDRKKKTWTESQSPEQSSSKSVGSITESTSYGGDSYFQLDENGNVTLKPQYRNLWIPGWLASGGIGQDGSGGGSGLITSVKGIADLGTPIANESLTETFSAKAIESIWEAVLGLQQSMPSVSLNNGASYSTIAINGTSANFYTKAQVDTLLNAINAFDYVVASSLPTASANTMYKIYLIPSADPQTGNIKDEYITIRGGSEGGYTYSWEQIGSTAIDLTGYATESWVESWVNQQGFLKTETDPTVPSWAKATNKPSYSLNEISGTDDLRAIEALTGTVGILKKTGANTWALDTNIPFNVLPSLFVARTQVASFASNGTLLGIDAISNNASSGNSDTSRLVWDGTNEAWHFLGNLYVDGWLASGGIGQGGSGGFGVEQITTNEDGTIDFHFTGGDITTVDLNHEHPQYPKYVHLSSESEMPANPDPYTMYIIDGSGGGGGGSYTLPIASASTLGGVKVGDGLSINSNTGVLSTATQIVYLTSESQMPATPDANTLYVILES